MSAYLQAGVSNRSMATKKSMAFSAWRIFSVPGNISRFMPKPSSALMG